MNYNTLFIGKVEQHFDTLPSTNGYAIELLSKNKPSEGTAISTYNQTAGRGQFGNTWLTNANQNITLSVILYPKFLNPRYQFELNKTIALGVYDFVSAYISYQTKIKWPNDVLVGDKKLAGILIQNALAGSKFAYSVIGIGININQQAFTVSGREPTSFALETNQIHDLAELKKRLYWHIEKRYLQLKAQKTEQLQSDYLKALYKYEEPHLFQKINGEKFLGVIKGVANNGELMINNNNYIEQFAFKEVRFL